MNTTRANQTSSGFTALRNLMRPQRPEAEREICEFCSVNLSLPHRHLLEIAPRKIICTCDPCALRFENVIDGRFKLIPRDGRALPDFQLTDAQWENLALPINLVFIFNNSLAGKPTAAYPSPAGATESLLTLECWQTMVAENPKLKELEPDVEALLINRIGQAREYFIAPMDACFELVGLIRKHWRGFSGGEDVWREIENFFSRLREETSAGTPPDLREAVYV
ncbi:MAG: DUF5947 family protein [Verrucomicrobiota bacterium]